MEDKKLKFLLIHPEISRTKYNFKGIIENECLELEYIMSMLKEKGHEVYIYDGQVEEVSISRKLEAIKPDVLYVCGRTRQENFMLEYCRNAKANNPNIVTIIGGLHAQLAYSRMCKDYVDYILITFDIFKILDIVDYHFYKKINTLIGIDGICFKENSNWLKNEPKPFDIKRLPLPDRNYFYEHPNNYQYLELEHAAWVRTAYCCPYHCKFCQRNKMNCGEYTYRDISDVVNEIERIQSDNIYIVDDDFLVNEERLKNFVKLIKLKNINKKYICYGRSDFIANNESLMQELKNIGLYYVLVGLEAINNNNLDNYNKLNNIDNNIKAIEICNRIGINIMGMFIVDLDFEAKDFKDLYNWIKEHNLRHVAISIFTPEFGLETYDLYKDRLITNNPSHWDYLHVVAKPDKMSVRMYYFYYYVLLIKLFFKAYREGIYDFINYGDYILSFIKGIFTGTRSNDNE